MKALDWSVANKLFQQGVSGVDIAAITGINYNTVKSHFRQQADKIIQPGSQQAITEPSTAEESDKKEILFQRSGEKLNADGTVEYDDLIETFNIENLTPDTVMIAHKLNPEDWQVISYTKNRWHGPVTGGGRVAMYQCKLTVKPVVKLISQNQINEMYDRWCENILDPSVEKAPIVHNGKLLELTFTDLHFNKLCWNGNTNNDFDFKIASARFKCLVNDIIERSPVKKYEKIIFPIGNDILNADNEQGTTTKGTPQDNDYRLPKAVDSLSELLIWAIKSFNRLGPVEVIYVPGNHDYTVSLLICKILKAWFRKYKTITFNDSPISRKYLHFGTNLIGLGHLDSENERDLQDLMSTEAPELWGLTKCREFHGAHKHKEMVREFKGSTFRRNPSVSGTDFWSYKNAYISAIRKNITYIWDKEKGLDSLFFTII